MLTYKMLDKDYLKCLWVADPKYHSLIAAFFSIITFLSDFLLSGKKSIYRIMQRLKIIPNNSNLKFSYLNHYYTNRTIYNYGWLIYSKIHNIKKAMNQVEVLGLKYFEQALSYEKGIIIFSAHLGCFFNAVFCERIIKHTNGRKVALLSPENKEKRKERIINQISGTSAGINFDLIDITIKTDAIKIIRTLKKKGIVGCTLDYAYPYTKNKEIEFLGRKVDFPIGLIEIGRKIDVLYLPCFSYIKNGRITLEFKEMFLSVKTENAEKDIDIISSKINNILEKKIMEIPEQWSFWLRLYYSKPICTISSINKS